MFRIAANVAVVCAFACNAQAQSASPLQRFDPADPALPVPAARYDSPYSAYQRFEEQKPASWRALNDEVERLGGHEGHIKGAGASEPPRAPSASDATRAAPSPAPQAAPGTAPNTAPNTAPRPAAGGAHKHHH